MDYKYIEQLLERYWNCETSLEEEQILRSFFRQKEVPAHLLRYKQLFAYQDVEKEKGLGDDFDTRILTRIERPVVKAQRLTMRTRFMPLFKAAAMIAVLFLMGTVMQHTMKVVIVIRYRYTMSIRILLPTPKWHTNLYCLQIRWQRLPLMIPVQGKQTRTFSFAFI